VPALASSIEGMPTVTVSGLPDLVAVLPYQLGYHPRSSVVAVCLHGRRMGMVARTDLTEAAHIPDVVGVLVPPLLRERPEVVLLIGYEDEAGRAEPVMAGVAAALEAAGVVVGDAAVVRADRWYALWGTAEGRCPPEGLPVPVAADVPGAASYVQAEVAPLADRDDLARLVAEDTAASAGVEAAVAALRARMESGRPPSRPGRVWGRILSTKDDVRSVAELSAGQVAAAAYSLHDLGWRDGLIASAAPGSLPLDALDRGVVRLLRRTVPGPGADVAAVTRVQARLLELCRRVPDACPEEAAEVCALTASVTWATGSGAVARDALDRALRLRPGHRLARLVEQLLDLGVRPTGLTGPSPGSGAVSNPDGEGPRGHPRLAAG
jgi:hypothetical protein